MKHIFLIISLLVPIVTPSLHALAPAEVKKLNEQKKSFTTQVKEFLKCVKGDHNCDPQKTKLYRSLLLSALFFITFFSATLYYDIKMREKERPAFEAYQATRAASIQTPSTGQDIKIVRALMDLTKRK